VTSSAGRRTVHNPMMHIATLNVKEARGRTGRRARPWLRAWWCRQGSGWPNRRIPVDSIYCRAKVTTRWRHPRRAAHHFDKLILDVATKSSITARDLSRQDAVISVWHAN